MKKVEIEIVDTKCPIDPAFSINDRVVIYLKNGKSIDSGNIRYPRGNAFLPLTKDALKEKFLDCCHHGAFKGEESQALGLYEKLTHLQDLKSIRTLFNLNHK
jgi:2-methylcitrate dehydratase PrpD